ncbi:hypothetical protein EV122DRAFT_259956 [Schizophyllum commune]|uniref:uncharacterized protein n=1 Tax=Schizophyllum commune (strain H4-8 / FGSC 9210) TaxID=578458 RepID=UPI002160F6F2|nr:uncharacterized protein SCHCODRAFT_02613122 [Schizophyllum commune H4-8]KAI5898772.1 hypothetical protein SCHCODRAFT_02613122 [Schizophyllum commune H4-8]
MSNYVTRLNNYFQTRQQTTRVTYSESSAGPSHARIWTVQCKVDGQPLGTGVAAQKSVAKEEAARQALQNPNLP